MMPAKPQVRVAAAVTVRPLHISIFVTALAASFPAQPSASSQLRRRPRPSPRSPSLWHLQVHVKDVAAHRPC